MYESQPRTIAKGGGRRWIYATFPKGFWQRLRIVTTIILLVLFYATPWLTIDGHPFIKLSFLSPSFVLFGNYILQYEIYRFVFLALLLIVTLFLASTLIGRAWCGYACPQTIFIEQIFGRIETLIEGNAVKRLAERNRPKTAKTIAKKVLKHSIFLLICLSFAATLVAIFTGPQMIFTGESAAVYWAIAILAGIAWFDGGYWKEQFCHIACPYARFQSVMQDNQTRTIGYDAARGEPRGRSKAKNKEGALGDCIDCGFCVRVCPSGIDIRQGAAQLECTACARCVDACDSIMLSLDRPLGLIRYDAISVFETPPQAKRSIFRPRIFIYSALWLALMSLGTWQFINRDLHHVSLLNVKGTLPYFQKGDVIQNLLSLKIGNQAAEADSYVISVAAEHSAEGVRIESPAKLGPIEPGQEKVIPVLLSVNQAQVGKVVVLEITSQLTGRVLRVKKLIAGP